jgi:predicted unusual protein kinase regulating ubiquinone biosynthesis (AarF/ABC1/UbiB family)
VKEARYTELFERRVRKAKLGYVRAPRVYFDVSGEDVLVTEFVTGIWMTEIIAALEHDDQRMLQVLERLDIDPKLVARRLLQTSQFGIFESLLFHADPHPANLLVRPGSKLLLIDFGSCGTYTAKERHVWRQLALAHQAEDVGQMVQAALAVLEPLPPIDVDEFSKRLEQVFWQDLYAFKSKHSEWWERTSAKIWISFLELSREYEIPMNLNMLRMIRSTLLYETVAARLFHRINAYREHHRYNLRAGRRARKRLVREARDALHHGVDERWFLRIEQLRAMGNRGLYLLQRFLDAPPFRFGMLVGKAVYAVSQVTHVILTISMFTLALAGTFELYHWLGPDHDFDLVRSLRAIAGNPSWYVFVVISSLLMLRRMVFRFLDREVG